MKSINQIRNGVMKYVEYDMLPGQTGLLRVMIKGIANLYAGKAETIIQELGQNKAIEMLHVIDGEMVDIERLYDAFAPEITGIMEIPLPAILKERAITFDREEIDKLYNRIMEA